MKTTKESGSALLLVMLLIVAVFVTVSLILLSHEVTEAGLAETRLTHNSGKITTSLTLPVGQRIVGVSDNGLTNSTLQVLTRTAVNSSDKPQIYTFTTYRKVGDHRPLSSYTIMEQ